MTEVLGLEGHITPVPRTGSRPMTKAGKRPYRKSLRRDAQFMRELNDLAVTSGPAIGALALVQAETVRGRRPFVDAIPA